MTERLEPGLDTETVYGRARLTTAIIGAVAVGKSYLLHAAGLDAVIPEISQEEAARHSVNNPLKTVSVLTPSPQWMAQLRFRIEGMSKGDVLELLDEARHTVRWTLAQHLSGNTDHLTIVNSHLATGDNVYRLRSFADGKAISPPADEQVSAAAESMQATIRHMYGSIGQKA